ncbi:hypothetical protein [uncultured Thiohalocapsa sp.]|uniref:hypothetical protein n=1 Tax=uncultured Thiohalocapsa sp. TaxID=768990 RepID=UPI0025D8AF85|nr:hypothetical protein [uncultured Thiohalocapsa sp.]
MPPLQRNMPQGRLAQASIRHAAPAGWHITPHRRHSCPNIDGPTIRLAPVRAQARAHHPDRGPLNLGLSGPDWIRETQADDVEIHRLVHTRDLRYVA